MLECCVNENLFIHQKKKKKKKNSFAGERMKEDKKKI
jgi:hypothetical protein